jgi:hypothetical protein
MFPVPGDDQIRQPLVEFPRGDLADRLCTEILPEAVETAAKIFLVSLRVASLGSTARLLKKLLDDFGNGFLDDRFLLLQMPRIKRGGIS